MNVRLNNNIYKLKFKKYELKENKYLKIIAPSSKYENNGKNNNYEHAYKFTNAPGSCNSINILEEIVPPNLGEQTNEINNNQKIH